VGGTAQRRWGGQDEAQQGTEALGEQDLDGHSLRHNIKARHSGQFSSVVEQRFCNSKLVFCLLWQCLISPVSARVFSISAFAITDSILP
jgi:hypothetical protein